MRLRSCSVLVVLLCVACQDSRTGSNSARALKVPPGTPAPRFISLHAGPVTETEVEKARGGTFTIFERQVKLAVPIDWKADPFSDRSWRFWLHTLVMLEPLLQDYAESDNLESLRTAAFISLDWIDRNSVGEPGISEFAWYDMAVAYRAAYFAYLARALAHESALSATQRGSIAQAAVTHAEWLYDNAHYKKKHNHGLFEDAGLLVTAELLAHQPRAGQWKERGRMRFSGTVRATFDAQSGLHLEHSPAYHGMLTSLVDKLEATVGFGQYRLVPSVAQMKHAAGWLMMPDGNYPQLGDTHLDPVEDWVSAAARQLGPGVGFFDSAGLAVHRSEGSYLAFVAWYHSQAHKHADELSFVWEAEGRPVIIDSGLYGYYYAEPGRQYAESSPAHNTVTFGRPFTRRDRRPFGSGMRDAKTVGDWTAFLADNPMLSDSGVHHARTLLYKPDHWLILVDDATGARCPEATQYLHFDSSFRCNQPSLKPIVLEDESGRVTVHVSPRAKKTLIVRGQKSPMQGFTFPHVRDWVEAPTIVSSYPSPCEAPIVTALSLKERPHFAVIESKRPLVRLEVDKEYITLSTVGKRVNLEVSSRTR